MNMFSSIVSNQSQRRKARDLVQFAVSTYGVHAEQELENSLNGLDVQGSERIIHVAIEQLRRQRLSSMQTVVRA